MKAMVKRFDPRKLILNLTLAFALLALSGMLHSAQARLAIGMSVATPQLSVRVQTGPKVHAKVLLTKNTGLRVVRARRTPRGVVTVRCTRAKDFGKHRGAAFGLSRQDRRIAWRLSRVSGCNRYEIMRLRRAGQSWALIAFELKISRHQLVIAQNLALHLD